MAVPLTADFWEFLLTSSQKEWGLSTYEQDWLFNELQGVDALLTDATLGRQWLLQMDAGAAAAGVTIQLCMAFPRHALQTLEMPTATQIRASQDHAPELGGQYGNLQWRIGFSSLLAWALALAPFKDNAWSVAVQPGGSSGNASEINPSLQFAISVLSAGPVTPGDGIGYSNAALIARTHDASGRLLQPSRSATAIDAVIAGRAFPGPDAPTGEIYATFSAVSGLLWDTVIAATLTQPYALGPAALTGVRASSGLPASLTAEAEPTAVAYSVNATTMDLSTLVVQPFDAALPITLLPGDEWAFQLWHVAPVHANGWSYLGELAKYVPVSPVRTVSVEVAGPSLAVSVRGSAGEAVSLAFWDTSAARSTVVACTLDASGRAVAEVPRGTCAGSS